MPIRQFPLTQEDIKWMRHAVDLGKQSPSEPGKITPKVGAVIVRDGQLLVESFRGETRTGWHAEYCALETVPDMDLRGATVYTTLEPCSRRSPEKSPCADHLIKRQVSTVFIGMYDPNPRIYCQGWQKLQSAGIALRDFDQALREEIRVDNEEFSGQYRHAVGMQGHARFDYTQNDGRFTLYADNTRALFFETRWTHRGKGSIYALDYQSNVAYARFRTETTQIDDPSALEFDSYSCSAAEGEVVVFRNEAGYALIKVTSVLAGPDRGDDRFELSFSYELRLKD